MTVPVVVLPDAAPRRRAFGVTSLVLGVLLIVGVALWLLVGGVFLAALVWVFPLVVVGAFIIGAIHLVVMTFALVTGVLAIVRDSGRVPGIIGIVLTLAATAAVVLVGIFFVEIANVLYAGAPASGD